MNKHSFIRSCFHAFMTPRECALEAEMIGIYLSRREIEAAFRSFENELPPGLLDNWENMTMPWVDSMAV